MREAVRIRRAVGASVGLAPTMGNLHAGHLALVQEARKRCDMVIASIYVNPLQFGQNEDLHEYPRTLEADLEALAQAQTDAVFLPDDHTMYPRGLESLTMVEVPHLSDILCGEHRPGHFRGVATVVVRLLNMVTPDIAFFGKKDYQQLMVIRRMVDDLAIPVDIVGVDVVRDADGLALSSRNRYLDATQRRNAPHLYKTLVWIAEQLRAGREIADLERTAIRRLEERGFVPDYVSIRRASDLEHATKQDIELVILAAARLGQARLIDNLELRL